MLVTAYKARRPGWRNNRVIRESYAPVIEKVTGTPLGRAELTVHAVNADPDTAELLGVPQGAAIFAIERLTYLADGRPVDAESLHIRADRLALHATVHRGIRSD